MGTREVGRQLVIILSSVASIWVTKVCYFLWADVANKVMWLGVSLVIGVLAGLICWGIGMWLIKTFIL